LTAILLVGVRATAWSAPWTAQLQAHGAVNGVSTTALEMAFGVADGATDEFDKGLDLLAPPDAPLPPGSQPPAPYLLNLLDSRSWLQHLTTDTRGEPANASGEIAWTLVIDADGGLPPNVTDWSITWDVSEADADWAEIRMTDDATGVDTDMRATTTLPVELGTTTTYTIRALPSAPTLLAPSVAEVGVPATVQALVYGSPDRITRALLEYKAPEQSAWGWRSFTPGSGDVWTADIPAWRITSSGVVWRAVFDDVDTGVHRTHTRPDPGYIPVVASAETVLRPTSGADPIWNVVAPTVWPDIDAVGPTLDSASGGFLAGWFAWRWNAAEQRWEVAESVGDGSPVATDPFSPGVPWFVAVVGNGSEPRHTDGVSVDATRAFGLPLSVGWNSLANPFPFAVAWSDEGVSVDVDGSVLPLSDAVSSGATDGRLIYLDVDSQSYVARDANELSPYAMPAGQGWWLHVDSYLSTLLIAPTPAAE
jgi:hypothetical protein